MATAAEVHFRAVAPLYMAKLMEDFPTLDVLDAAAIFGNFGHESKGLTDDQEDKPVVKGSRGGLNWAQWTGPRRRAMEAFCKANQLDPNSDEAAYAFLCLELDGAEKAAIRKVHAAKTLDTKVVAFEKAFLRAGVKHYPSRKKWAAIALDAYGAPKARGPRPATKKSVVITDPAIIEKLQTDLKALGYTEVGNPDGRLGKMTETAILAFRNEHDLPLSTSIDDDLLLAIDQAEPREMEEKRAEAKPAEVRAKVPEARASFWSQAWAWVLGIPATIGTLVSGAIDAIPGARDMLKPVKDIATDIPGWVWFAAVGGVALAIVLFARHGGKQIKEAYQAGERR